LIENKFDTAVVGIKGERAFHPADLEDWLPGILLVASATTAAAATTISTAAASVPAAVAATATVSAATAATAAAFNFRTGFVYVQGASANLAAVEGCDGFVSLFRVGHFYKSETT
jgi:hypothetical protein